MEGPTKNLEPENWKAVETQTKESSPWRGGDGH